MKRFLKAFVAYLGYDIRARVRDRYAIFEENASRDHELLKSFAKSAAGDLGAADGRKAIREIFLAETLQDQPSVEYSRIELGDDRTLDVGIWRRQGRDANAPFTRRMDRRDEWSSWADVEKLQPKRSKWRIILLGESVARGFLYDPQFNPAMAVSAMLKAQLGSKNVDVVDLAKSNLSLYELKTCVGQSLALAPDLLVIFAGNNWRPQLTTRDIPYVQSILERDGVPGMKAFLDEARRRTVSSLVAQVSQVLNSRGTKVIWVVPEFNLADWADPPANAPQLPQQRNQQWHVLDERTTQALRKGDFSLASQLGKKMTELDGNTSAVPLRVLAECCKSAGDLEGTRQYLELSRDAEAWDPSFSLSPRISSVVQNVLREAALLPGSFVVDLPSVVSRHLGGQLPDRRIFLDYCHMTAEGINVAAAAIASEALAILANITVSQEELFSRAPSPSEQMHGKACFLAAVHNSHFYQRSEIVRYWCDQALKHWPKTSELMRRYIDYETRNLPMIACKSGLELLQLDELGTVRYLASGTVRRLDLALCDAVVASLNGMGLPVGSEIDRLRIEQHSPKNGPKELTDFYYSSAVPSVSERQWTTRSFPNNRGSHSDCTAALWKNSLFLFVGRGGEDVVLKLTYRVPMTSGDSTVTIEVNGRPVAELPAQPTWCTRDIFVAGSWVEDGVNKILVSWPTEEPVSEIVIGRIVNELTAQRLPRFGRVFGEIHTLSALILPGAGLLPA